MRSEKNFYNWPPMKSLKVVTNFFLLFTLFFFVDIKPAVGKWFWNQDFDNAPYIDIPEWFENEPGGNIPSNVIVSNIPRIPSHFYHYRICSIPDLGQRSDYLHQEILRILSERNRYSDLDKYLSTQPKKECALYFYRSEIHRLLQSKSGL